MQGRETAEVAAQIRRLTPAIDGNVKRFGPVMATGVRLHANMTLDFLAGSF